MAFRIPEIGEWYIDREQSLHFEVIAIDVADRSIEIQYVDGEVSEVDFESWRTMQITSAAPTEDWAAAYDSDTSMDNLLDPISALEGDSFEGSDEYY